MHISENKINEQLVEIEDYIKNDLHKASEIITYFEKVIPHLPENTLRSRLLFKAGKYYSAKSEYEKALDYYEQTLLILTALDDIIFLEKTYSNMGHVKYYMGDYEEAIRYILKSIEMTKALNDINGEAISYNSIGAIYFSLENYDEALKYYFYSLDIVSKYPKKTDKDLDTLAMLNSNIGGVLVRQKKYDEALKHLKESITIRILSNNQYGKAQSFNNIASLYFKMESYSKSLNYYRKSIEIKEEISDHRGLAASYIGMAELYHRQGNSLNTEFYLKKAVTSAENSKNMTILIDVYKKISIFYEEVNYYKESFMYYRKYIDLNNKLYSKENDKKLNDQKIKYEVLLKEKTDEINKLKQTIEALNAQHA